MSKVGGALPSWYWPAGIPRRVPVPQQPLGRLLRQRFTKEGDKPAIISDRVTLSYSELLARITAIAGGLQALATKGPIAVAGADPVDSLVMVFGGIFAGRQVFLPQRDDSPEAAEKMSEAKVAAILTSSGEYAAPPGLSVVRSSELQGPFNEALAPKRAADPAVMLPADRGIVTHSHFSLSAMAASLAAFIPRLREMAFVCTGGPLGCWETLSGILIAFANGMPIVFRGSDGPGNGLNLAKYVIVHRDEADSIVAAGRLPAYVADASFVFLSTGFFEEKWRRRFEALCDRPIFTIWGVPEVGPIVAAHPTWLPPHGHGFPLVNVSLLPIDPASGQISIVPWEMLEQAEMGVEALSAMIGYAEPARHPARKAGNALRTGQIITMDHVGVVVLHKEHGLAAG